MGSRGSKLDCSSHTTRVIDSNQAIYFEDYTGTSQYKPMTKRNCVQRTPVFILVPTASASISSPVIYQNLIATPDNELIEVVNLKAREIHL